MATDEEALLARASGEPQVSVIRAFAADGYFEMTGRIETEARMLGFLLGATVEDFGEAFRRFDRARSVREPWPFIRSTAFSIVADRIEARGGLS